MNEAEDLKPLYTAYLEEELYLNAQGEWHHDGTPFTHQKLALLFHRSVQLDRELKKYIVRIGLGRATFKHDGYVRFVSSIREERGTLIVHYLDNSSHELDFSSLRLNNDGVFLLYRENELPARFLRNAQQQLLQYGESENSLAFNGEIYTVKPLEDLELLKNES